MLLNELVLFSPGRILDYSPDKNRQKKQQTFGRNWVLCLQKTGKEHQTFLSSFPSNRTENIFWFVFKFNFLFASEGKEVNPHIFDVMSPWIKERWCFCVCVTLIGYKQAFTSCFHRQDAVLATDHNAVHCTITIFLVFIPSHQPEGWTSLGLASRLAHISLSWPRSS